MGGGEPSTAPPPTAETEGTAPKMAEVLDDLAMRFVVNCPAEEQESFERLLFQVEAAFWFYEDQYREIWPDSFPSLTLLTFAQQMFKSCPMLKPFEKRTKEIFDAFMTYKQQIPTCGAMLLNASCTKLLLVKGWKAQCWGFPKGKIDKGEEKVECAVREVLEEVGYDISAQVDPNAYLESKWREQTIRLYIVAGVPDSFAFATRTRKEISEISWHKLKELPGTKDEQQAKEHGKFWMVAPFVGRLKRYLSNLEKQKKKLKGQRLAEQQKHAAAPSQEPPSTATPPPAQSAKGKAASTSAGGAQPVPLGVKGAKTVAKGGGVKGGVAAPSVAPPPSAATPQGSGSGSGSGSGQVQVLQRPSAASSDATGVQRPPREHAFLDFRFDSMALGHLLDKALCVQ